MKKRAEEEAERRRVWAEKKEAAKAEAKAKQVNTTVRTRSIVLTWLHFHTAMCAAGRAGGSDY